MTYIKLKNKQWWVWSSKKASLDCLPQAKFDWKDLAEQYVINRVSPTINKNVQNRKIMLREWYGAFRNK